MLHDLCRERITLRFPDGVADDGKTAYTECAARAFVIDYGKKLLKEVGLQQDTKFFIIASGTEVNAGFSGGLDGIQAVCGEQTYDLKSIKACRQLDGWVECYSCAAF